MAGACVAMSATFLFLTEARLYQESFRCNCNLRRNVTEVRAAWLFSFEGLLEGPYYANTHAREMPARFPKGAVVDMQRLCQHSWLWA